MAQHPYVRIQDKHGAVALVYIQEDNEHHVNYVDSTGQPFYTETFKGVSPEIIEQSVMDWALGKRNLI